MAGRDAQVDLIHVVEAMPWYSRVLGGTASIEEAQMLDLKERLDALARSLLDRGLRASSTVFTFPPES